MPNATDQPRDLGNGIQDVRVGPRLQLGPRTRACSHADYQSAAGIGSFFQVRLGVTYLGDPARVLDAQASHQVQDHVRVRAAVLYLVARHVSVNHVRGAQAEASQQHVGNWAEEASVQGN